MYSPLNEMLGRAHRNELRRLASQRRHGHRSPRAAAAPNTATPSRTRIPGRRRQVRLATAA